MDCIDPLRDITKHCFVRIRLPGATSVFGRLFRRHGHRYRGGRIGPAPRTTASLGLLLRSWKER